ncbi:MAG: holo-ACP synthase [Candidatus Omnitrophica bacterium]|nr:holo-ACP synthase [Candidatus Omnitrophota bacterium]MBU1923473.1 holo-ACP synthase [Candidatus Omnitrophota bacterium]
MMFIGTGVDITEVRRIRTAVEKWGDDFLRRVFTNSELKNAKTKNSFYQHLAGRFAAKEAVFKAAGDNSLSWRDIQINNDRAGKPVCQFLNGRGRYINVYISISHVKTYAVASAVVTKKA